MYVLILLVNLRCAYTRLHKVVRGWYAVTRSFSLFSTKVVNSVNTFVLYFVSGVLVSGVTTGVCRVRQ